MAEAKLYGQNKGGMSINGIIKDYYAYAGEKISAGDLVEYVNGVAGKIEGISIDTAIDNINEGTGRKISAVQLDNNRVFIAHSYGTDYYLYGAVCTINGANITFQTDIALINSLKAGYTISTCLLPNGSIFLAHSLGDYYHLYGMVVNVSGTKITTGEDTLISDSTSSGYSISTCLLPNGNVFIAHDYANHAKLMSIVCTISDTKITYGTDTTLSSTANSGYRISTCLLPNGNVFIAHSYGENYYLYGIVATISGTTITKGNDTSLLANAATKTGSYISTCLLPNGNVFVAHSYGSNYYLYAVVCTVSGTIIGKGANKALRGDYSCYGLSTVLLDNGNVFVIHGKGDSERYLYGEVCTIDGTTITGSTDTQLSAETYTGFATSSLLLNSGTIFIAHSNTNSYYLYAQIFGIDDNNIPTNNIIATEYETQVRKVTTGQFDGIAKTSGEGGDDTGHKDIVSIWTKE